MMRAVERTIDAYVASLSLPADLSDKIGLANADLYNGPVYLDECGDECSCFDPFAKQIDFSGLCSQIGDALDAISDIYVDTDCEDWSTSEPEATQDGDEIFEPHWSSIYHIDRSDIIRRICGRELARHVS